MKNRVWQSALCFCGLLVCLAASPARADKALLVGIDHYANLPADNQLQGPDNDVALMAVSLKRLGFTTTTLTDGRATRQGILNALAQMRTQCKPSERFVFFYAGHGTKTPAGDGAIVPSDAQFDREETVITQAQLNSAIADIPASSRTALLDSCYSGAMALARGKGLVPDERPRFVNLFALPKSLVTVSAVNAAAGPGPAASGICYFSAANGYQEAREGDIAGKCDGYFTAALATYLTDMTQPWGHLQQEVTGDVVARSGDAQTPTLSADFADKTIFGSQPATARAPESRSLWTQFNADRSDPAVLSLAMSPDQSSVTIGDKFSFTVTPARDGCLVVLELDTDGNLDLVYPASPSADAGQVPAGQDIRLPVDATSDFSVNKPGAESIKALLFLNADDAQRVLDAFPPAPAGQSPSLPSWQDASTRMIGADAAPSPTYWTAQVSFEAVDKSAAIGP